MENLGDLGAFLIFLVVIGANLIASIAKKKKVDRERSERKTAPPLTPTTKPRMSHPKPELFPKHQTPMESQEGWPQRPATPVPQRRTPRPASPTGQRPQRKYPPQQPAPAEPPPQPTTAEPDWREILENPFKQLEEMFGSPPKPPEQKRQRPRKRQAPPPSPPMQPAVTPKPVEALLPKTPESVCPPTPQRRQYGGIPQPGARLCGEALRRAVIWNEILGPPIALRPMRHLPPIHR